MKKHNPTTSTQELKRLQSLLNQLKLEFTALKESGTRLNMEIATKEQQIKEVEQKIHKLKGADENIIVSEHAIIRYLERVYRLDLEKIKHEILPEVIVARAKALGNGRYATADHTLLIKDNVVITVLADDAA